MYRLWLIFSQAATVAVAVLFVVSTFHPEWLPQRARVAVVQQGPARHAPAEIEPESLHVAVERATPSVVNIFTSKEVRVRRHPLFDDPLFKRFFGDQVPDEEQRTKSLGSGVIVSPSGYILTNQHVVEAAEEIEVALPNGRKLLAKVVGDDPETDLAVLRVDAEGLPAITFGSSDALRVGDVVLAIGNPFGVGQTVTSGIVSATGRGLGIEDYEDFIQTDAPINPGNSGGALVDVEGRLIGINTAIFSRSGGNQGIGFAIPSDLARNVMNSLVKYGHVTRGYLGVMIQDVTPALAKEFKLKDAKGALVGDVVPKGPADKAGLKDGDVVVQFNGKNVTDSRHLKLMVAEAKPDSTVPVKILRDGSSKTIEVTVRQLPGTEQLARAETPNGGDSGT